MQGPRKVDLLITLVQNMKNDQMNTFRKHAHCAVLCSGLIQTLNTWVASSLLCYRDDCRRKANFYNVSTF